MKIKNILSNIFLIFAVIVLICAVIFVSTVDKNDPHRFFLNLKFYQTTTGSMEPYMKIKSMVIVIKADISDFAVGDVVSFISDDSAVAHRVIGITDEGLQTKGDNNRIPDAVIVKPENIIGKCVIVMNWVAVFLDNLGTPSGIIKVIVIPVLSFISIILAIEYLKTRRTIKKAASKKEQQK